MHSKRKQILDAAHRLFIEKGFALTSIQDILDQAGIAKGTFYNYFNSKTECLLAILETVTEEVDKKRREIAIGKDPQNEVIFIKQMAVRMNMNRQHHLLAVFESVSFSEDEELKAFMRVQYRNELQWITKRLKQIYPAFATPFIFDHAVMLVGIVHHMMHVWKLGSKKEIETEKIIRYALSRVKSMIDDQAKNTEFIFTENWLGFTDENTSIELDQVIKQLEAFSRKVMENGISKQNDYIQFLLTELQDDNPRLFLIESVLMAADHVFEQSEFEHEAKHIVHMVENYFQS